MKNIKLTLEYDGTNYQGWQHLSKKDSSNTICGKITDTLCRMTGENIELSCAARTESGVHASCQTVSFKAESTLSALEFKSSLNQYLPQDIAVLFAEEVPDRFHAALNCISQTYTYRIQTCTIPDVFLRKIALHVPGPLDVKAMSKGASALAGTWNFLGFSSGKKKKSTEKTVLHSEIISPSDGELHIILQADGFLHLMPRLIIGTFLDIGLGKRSAACIPAILSGEEATSKPAPAHGLCLTDTHYLAS